MIDIAPVIYIGFLVILIAVVMTLKLASKIRQHYCRHERYYVNGGGDAICAYCRKNLGFVSDMEHDPWRKNVTGD